MVNCQRSIAGVKGFSLIEILIVISVMAIVATIISPYFGNSLTGVNIDDAANIIISDAKSAQARAVNGIDGVKWGVCFRNPATGDDTYEIVRSPASDACTDDSENPSNPLYRVDSIFFLQNGVANYVPSNSTTVSVVFNKIDGTTTSTDGSDPGSDPDDISVILRLKGERRTITIAKSGNMSVSEPTSLPSFIADVETLPASSIGTTAATLEGSVNPNNSNSSATGWFRYRSTSSATCVDNDSWGTRVPSSGGSTFGPGTSPVRYSSPISGLDGPNVTYWFCAIASNPDGTSYGSVRSFTTTSPPEVETSSDASPVTPNSATLRGTVNPNSASTTAYFRWGTSNLFCPSLPNTTTFQNLGSGGVTVPIVQQLSNLNPSTTYYFCAAASNSSDTISFGDVESFATPAPTTTIADYIVGGANPNSVTLAPEAGITGLDSFALSTDGGTDTITAMTVTLSDGSFGGLSEVRITSNDDITPTTYFTAVLNPLSNMVSFSGGTPFPLITTTPTQYKVRIIPKSHANMPVVPVDLAGSVGSNYYVTGTVTAFTSTNAQFGSDSESATITIDNLSPSSPTGFTGVAGDTQVSLSWANPGADFSNVVILRKTSPIADTDVPAEGSSPTLDSSIGSSTVRYISSVAAFTDTGLTNGTSYYYKIFAKDTNGNYSAGVSTGPYVPAVTRYWVGGAGIWDATDTAHWSATSGGSGGASVPTTSTNVLFNASSFTGFNQTVTVNVSASAKDINWTGVDDAPIFAGAGALNIAGSFTLTSNVTRTYTGVITFSATTTGKTITMAGNTLAGAVTFDGVLGGWTLQDNFSIGSSSDLTLTNGTLDTNGKTVTVGRFVSSNSNTRTLTLGSSTINVNSGGLTAWSLDTSTGMTLNAGSSTIVMNSGGSGLSGGGLVYNNLTISTSLGGGVISGANTFNNLTRTGTANKNTQLVLYDNQVITGTLTIAGNSPSNRVFVLSSVIGVQKTLTAAAVSMSNVDFKDINGAGSWNLSAITGGSGDAGGNSGITFTPSATQYYKTAGNANWSDSTKWFLGTNGTGGVGRVPLPQDDAVFDANSITAGGITITQDMPRAGRSIDWTGVTNTPAWTTGNSASIFGSLTIASGMTLTASTQTYTFEGRGSFNLTMGGKTFEKDITLNAPGGTLTLQDAMTLGTTRTLTLTNGTFNANNKNISMGSFSSSNANIRSITMGSGTWTLTGTGTVWDVSTATGLTLAPDTSTIIINNATSSAKTFSGDNKIYGNLQFTGAGTGALTIIGNNTFANLTISTAPKTVNFTASTTQTATGTFTANGSFGNMITLRSTSTPTKWTLNAAATNLSYVDVKDSTGAGAGSPFPCSIVISGCFNSSNNTGWTF